MELKDIPIEDLVCLYTYKYLLEVEIAFEDSLRDEIAKNDLVELEVLLEDSPCSDRYTQWVLEDQTKKGYPENFDPEEYGPIDVRIE